MEEKTNKEKQEEIKNKIKNSAKELPLINKFKLIKK